MSGSGCGGSSGTSSGSGTSGVTGSGWIGESGSGVAGCGGGGAGDGAGSGTVGVSGTVGCGGSTGGTTSAVGIPRYLPVIGRGTRESERGALRVLADSPLLARVDHGSTERLHALECARQIVDREVGKREAVAWAGAPLVYAERRFACVRLPALPFVLGSVLERDTQQLAPEAQRALGVVGGELDQRQRRFFHMAKIPVAEPQAACASGAIPVVPTAGASTSAVAGAVAVVRPYRYQYAPATNTIAPAALPSPAKAQLRRMSSQPMLATPAKRAAGRKNMLATRWSNPIATKAVIGKKTATSLPATSCAPSAIQTARHTSQLHPMPRRKICQSVSV